MAINLAKKYSDKVVERFSQGALTDKGLNKDYNWQGVKTVAVYTIPTVAMGNYERSGLNRFGSPTDLQDTVQEMTLSKDRAFTFVIDKGDNSEQMMIKEAGKCLARQLKEVVTPEIDAYRLNVWATASTTQTTGTAAAITKANAYEKFLDSQEKLDNELVPSEGRICYARPSFIKYLKLSDDFIKAGDLSQKMLINGQVGEVDGVAIVKVPASKMPKNVAFINIHPSCTCAPMKLEDYRIQKDPIGVSGHVVEGRVIYDCFVLETKGKAICKHMEA